jgi:hypothetical protein
MNDRTRNRAGAGKIPGPPPKDVTKSSVIDESAKLKKLEESRRQLFELISKFRTYMSDTTLPENKTATAKEIESAVALDVTKTAWDLNFQNLDEGTMTLMSLLLHSLLLTRDELNKLKFQNAYLAKQVSSLKQQVSSPAVTGKSPDEPKK